MKTLDLVKKTAAWNRAPQRQVLGIGGSPRKNGNSDILLKHILRGAAKNKIVAHGVHLRELQFQGCIGCEKCRKDKICTGLMDGMSLLYPKIIDARALVLVSPVHNYNVTSWMKAFIDRLYCFYHFDNHRPRGWSGRLAGQGRKAVLAAVCEQAHKEDMGFTIDAMRLPLEALGYEIIGELPVYGIFDRGAVKAQEEVLTKASQLGMDLAASLLKS